MVMEFMDAGSMQAILDAAGKVTCKSDPKYPPTELVLFMWHLVAFVVLLLHMCWRQAPEHVVAVFTRSILMGLSYLHQEMKQVHR